MLITFDDGYRDNLDNAAPVLQQATATRPCCSCPIGYLDDRQPLPHEEHLAAQRHPQPHDRLGGARASSSGAGIRIESHGISHRPLADLEVDEAAREIALSKLRLEERARPAGARVLLREGLRGALQAGPPAASSGRPATTSPSRRSRARTRRRPIRCSSAATTSSRTPPRTFELVLAGACDLISLKDTVTGTHARRIFNAALGTSTK